MMAHGIIFITAKKYAKYGYNDGIYKELESENYILKWKGQLKGGRDHIVVNSNKIGRTVHVCRRADNDKPYEYYGVIASNTIRQIVDGDHANNIPNEYLMQLDTISNRLRAPFKQVFVPTDGSGKYQVVAALGLGLVVQGTSNGIYAATELII